MVESSMTIKKKINRNPESKKDEGGTTNTTGFTNYYSSSSYINPNTIEIAFVIDATGSMRSYIDGVRSCLKELVIELKKEINNYSLLFGICFYRDKKDEGILLKKKKKRKMSL